MERSKIPMLNRFDTISHIMRYYASTHKAFLLLSSLCSDTRAKLDEYYNEFIWCMEGNWAYVNLHLDSNNFLISFDLFKISIIFTINDSNFNAFIQFIKQLKNPFGIQFQNHLFNSHIKINTMVRKKKTSHATTKKNPCSKKWPLCKKMSQGLKKNFR